MPRILIVDDSETDRLLAGGLLDAEHKLTVEYAASGREALDRLEADPPDLVLTDLIMPEMDGLGLVATAQERFPLVPVVIMTARGSEDLAARALRAGAASYIPKASLARDLLDVVYAVLDVSYDSRYQALLMQSMKRTESVFVLANEVHLTGPLVSYLQQCLRGMGACEESETTRIGVAIEEALTNALHHGNLEVASGLRRTDPTTYERLVAERRARAPYKDRRIRVSATLDRKQAVFVIRDEGAGFDPDSLPDPTDPANLAKPHGRGVLLMRTFMDEVRFNESGNEVTLIKRCRQQPPADDDE